VDKRRPVSQPLFNEDSFPHPKTVHYERIFFLDDEGLSLDASIITRSSSISLIPKNSGIPQAEFFHQEIP
jgi:hypothetical protein